MSTFVPSLLLGETHSQQCREPLVLADAVQRIADEGYFKHLELPDISDAAARVRIGTTVHDHSISVTMWLAFVMIEEGLDISSLDTVERVRAVSRIKEFVDPAVECGVGRFALFSGPDPGPELRSAATDCLYQSLCELGEAIAARDADMQLVFEPLDREAHKNKLIGPIAEAVALVTASSLRLGLGSAAATDPI